MGGGESIVETIHHLIVGWADKYLLWGIVYFPITELVLAGIIGTAIVIFLILKRKEKLLIIPFIGMLLSLVILSVVQGRVTPYRACQVFTIFIAFAGMMFVYVFCEYYKKWSVMAVAVMMLLCICQSIYLNYFLTINHYRSEEEGRVICNIGEELERNYDISKPIVFTGVYSLSENIIELASISKQDIRWKIYSKIYAKLHNKDFDVVFDKESRKLPQTNVNSVITWAMGEQIDIQKLFEFYGFECKTVNNQAIIEEAYMLAYRGVIPGYPQKGYIKEFDDYIIVCLN